MSYSLQQYKTLQRLGIELLPPLSLLPRDGDMINNDEPCRPILGNLPVREAPVPGKRCPTCLSRGQTVWVIPGKYCPSCRTEVN